MSRIATFTFTCCLTTLPLGCTDDGGDESGSDASNSETNEDDSDTAGTDTGTEAGTTESGSSEADSESDSGTGTDTDTESETDTETDTGVIEPDDRQLALEAFAPRIYFTADEPYMPSSVPWSYPFLQRIPDGEGRYWVHTAATLDSASDTLPYFAGELETSPVYGYWADKGGGIVDLVYFIYFPYNRGKEVANTIWGNHVGDWEHVTVRLADSGDGLEPSQVYLSAHNFGGAYTWGNGEVELAEGTHPVVYAAKGSHGFWAQPGNHVYQSIGETDPFFDVCITLVCADLTDETSAGVAWDTWDSVYGMDFFTQEGLVGVDWPEWMSDDFTNPGEGDPSVPGGGPIYRWGNSEDCSVLGIPIDITDLIGVCRLEDGPTGPVSKGTWGAELQ